MSSLIDQMSPLQIIVSLCLIAFMLYLLCLEWLDWLKHQPHIKQEDHGIAHNMTREEWDVGVGNVARKNFPGEWELIVTEVASLWPKDEHDWLYTTPEEAIEECVGDMSVAFFGTRVAISMLPPATYDAKGYEALIYEDLGEIVSVESYNEHFKHQDNMKFFQIVRDPLNDSQGFLRDALNSQREVSGRIRYPNGDKDYFRCVVTSLEQVIQFSFPPQSLTVGMTFSGELVQVLA